MKESVIKVLSKELDTRDKRYMFLKLEFPKFVSRIDLEGSSYNVAHSIYGYINMQCATKDLIHILNLKFKAGILTGDELTCVNCGSTNVECLESLPPQEHCLDCGHILEL